MSNSILDKIKVSVQQKSLKVKDFVSITEELLQKNDKQIFENLKNDNFIASIGEFHKLVLNLCDSKDIKINDCYFYHNLVKSWDGLILSKSQAQQWYTKYHQLEFIKLLDKTGKLDVPKAKQLVKDIDFYILKINLEDLSSQQQQKLFSILDNIKTFLLDQTDVSETKLIFKNIVKIVSNELNYQPHISNQVFSLEINPLDENFNMLKPSFSNKQPLGEQFQGVKFSNLNIDRVSLDVNSFGFNGQVDINLVIDSEEFHQQYLFLYHNQPLSILLTIQQQYKFKVDPDKRPNFVESLVYHGISDIDSSTIEFTEVVPFKYDDPTSKQEKQKLEYRLKISYRFCDPLQAFLNKQYPLRIVQKSSYADVIAELLSPFTQWISFDTKFAKILEQPKQQLFIMTSQTDKRSFYDILMEILSFYQLRLQCDYLSKYELEPVDQNNDQKVMVNQLTNYIVYSDINSLEPNQPVTIPPRSLKMSLWHLDEIKFRVNNTLEYKSQQINADAKLLYTDSLFEEQDNQNNDDNLPKTIKIPNVLDEHLVDYSDSQIYENMLQSRQDSFTKEQQCHSQLKFIYQQWPLLDQRYPYPFAIELSEHIKMIAGQYGEDFYLSGYNIDITLTNSSKILRQKKINSIVDDPDKVAKDPNQSREKISAVGVLDVTHTIKVKQNLISDNLLYPRYANYKTFVPITIKGTIYTHKEVDDKNKYEYLTLQQDQESAISVDELSQATEISMQEYSEKSVFYSLKINPAFAFKKPENDRPFCIFFPVQETQYIPHSYIAFANGDIIEVKILNCESVIFNRVISNRLESVNPCSEEFRQENGYGLQQEAHIAYIKSQEYDQLQFQQVQDEQQGLNQISLSKKDGLTLYYSNQKSTS